MEKEPITGKMVRFTKESGCRVPNTVLAYGSAQKDRHTWVSGGTTRCTAMECISGRTETSTRESGSNRSNLVKGQTSLLIKTCTQEPTVTVYQMAAGSTSGNRVPLTLETSLMATSKEKENGRKMISRSTATSIKGATSRTRSMAKASSIGRVATITSVAMPTTCAMLTARCIGMMGPSTKANGSLVLSMELAS